MEIYHIITVATQDRQLSKSTISTLAIEGLPAIWLREYINDRENIVLLNSIPITKGEYELWEDMEQNVYMFM